jgi:hypothetical protein
MLILPQQKKQPMTPAFSTLFNLNTQKAVLSDVFDYSGIIATQRFGNFRAKIGNSIFYQNTQFDSNADIVPPASTKQVDLPLQNGKPQAGSYEFTYSVMLVNQVLAYSGVGSGFFNVNAPGSATFSTITLTSPPQDLEEVISALLAQGLNVQVGLYDSGNSLITQSDIVSSTGSTITFESITESGFANIAKVRIIGTNTYENTQNFLFTGCPNVDVELCVTVDCYRSKLTAADTTQYPANLTSLTRTLQVQYPLLANGNPVATAQTTSNSSLTVGPNIWTGGYTITLNADMTYVQTDTLVVIQTITKYANPNVQCDANLCKALECIESFRTKYMEAQKTGARDLNILAQQNINILLFCNSYQIAVQCENTKLASQILSDLINYMGAGNCHCGCNDTKSDTDEPKEIYPLFSSN